MARTKARALAARKPATRKRKQSQDGSNTKYENTVKRRRTLDAVAESYIAPSHYNTRKRKRSQDAVFLTHNIQSKNSNTLKCRRVEPSLGPTPLTVDALARFEATASPHPNRSLTPLNVDFFSDTGETHWSKDTDGLPDGLYDGALPADSNRAKRRVKSGKSGRSISYRPWDPVSSGLPPADYYENMPAAEKTFWLRFCSLRKRRPESFEDEWYWDAKAGHRRRRVTVKGFFKTSPPPIWLPNTESRVRATRTFPASPTYPDLTVDLMDEHEYNMHQSRVWGYLRDAETQPAPPEGIPGIHMNAPLEFEHIDRLAEHQLNRRIVDGLLDVVESVEVPDTPIARAIREAEDEWERWNWRREVWV